MFELGKLSSGHAAQLAGRSPGTTSLHSSISFASRRSGRTRAEFFEACSRYQVSVFNYDPEEAADELRRDMETLRNLPGPE